MLNAFECNFKHKSDKSQLNLFDDNSHLPAGKSTLGIYTKSCNPPDAETIERIKETREKRYRNQELARKLIGGRLEVCGRIPAANFVGGNYVPNVEKLSAIKILEKTENFLFGGLMRCGNVWTCPCCASVITEFRRNELQTAHKNALEKSLYVSMLTLTVRHYAKDCLQDVLDGISHALRLLKNRKAFKRFEKEIQLFGMVRTLEVTSGENGWHPHFHILIFSRKEITAENWKLNLLTQWQHACIGAGLPCPNEHGVDLVNGEWAAAYCTKWGIEEEMSKGHIKQGKKNGHVSPFGLLNHYAEGDEKAGAKFQEFAKCFKGKRQLVWSKGLKAALGLNDEKTDEEILAEAEKGAKVFMTISYDDYKLLIALDKRAECLDMCRLGPVAVRAFLDSLWRDLLKFPFGINQPNGC